MKINPKSYIKATLLATVLTVGGSVYKCTTTRDSVPVKDTVEFAHPTAQKLIASMENGAKYSKVVFTHSYNNPRMLKPDSIDNYSEVPRAMLDTLKQLADTMELYYQVYRGKADNAIQKARGKKPNLVTVGHGNTGRDYITLAGGLKAYEGDYISQYAVDSLFNSAVIEKDSILKVHISPNTYDNLEPYQKDAILSYLFNVNEKILNKHDSKRAIPESFWECIEQGKLPQAQAKFNVEPSSSKAAAGLAKRNIIQMLVFGNGEIYDNKYSKANFNKQLSIIKNRANYFLLKKEIIDILRNYGIEEEKLTKLEVIFDNKSI